MSQAIQGENTGSKMLPSHDVLLQRAVGTCPVVEIKVRGVPISCLLDTGSQVSTITEKFFYEHLGGQDKDVLSTTGWLKLTAANGLDIPYKGYLELEVEAMGMNIPHCGFLVVKDLHDSRGSAPGIIGMNVISRCRQLAQAEFDTTLGGKLLSEWRTAFQNVQECRPDKTVMVRTASKGSLYVPAGAVTVVQTRVQAAMLKREGPWLLEPSRISLPGGVVVMPTLVNVHGNWVPVQICNLSEEDVWLHPRTRLGVLMPVQCMDNEQQCEVRFQRIAADTEQISLDMGEKDTDTNITNLLDNLDVGGTTEQQAQLRSVLSKYAQVFAVGEEDLGYTDRVVHEIKLVDDAPVNLPYRRIPPTQYKEVKEHISQLLRKGVIQESSSAYVSPVVVVRKSDGTIRLCVDYRKLNQKTMRDAFHLPRIDESFDALQGAKFFSSIDLASGYHQVAVAEHDRHKTAFTTPFGLYEHLRMPFGVCNGPATFQRLMQATMNDLVFQILLVYLDDICLFSNTFSEHLERLDLVLRRLQETGLKVKIEKCHFLQE